MPRHSHPPHVSAGPAFADPEGLRAALTRLHEAGPGAWRHDAEATELMRFTADRYGALARKYGLEPADAAAAAFEAMLNDSTRTADDPWAVVTVAVRITLIAENRAQGLLTSTERARRPQYSAFHDAERFSDRENELIDYHPALRVCPDVDNDPSSAPSGGEPGGVVWVVDDTVTLLTVLGWPVEAARTGVEYVAARLSDIGDRVSAYETLRRDKSARALLDMPHDAWIGLLRIVLGHPTAMSMNGRRGVLVRLLIGDTLCDLLGDDELVLAVATANPGGGGRDG